MPGFSRCSIAHLCSSVCSGGTPRSMIPSYYNGDIPWLNTKEVNFNRIYDTERKITVSGLVNSSAKWVPPNSVVVAMYGATAGRCAITKIPLTTNQACCNLVVDSAKADYRFVYYALCHGYARLASSANGGAQQNLNALIVKDFEIMCPPLPTQRKIAAVLSSLDDKIENNNAICRNLEEQAAACYDKISSNGNCQPVLLGDIAQKVAMGPFGSNIKVSTFVESGVPIISGGHLHGKIVQGNEFNYITEEHAQRLKNSMVGVDDIVLTHAGNIGQVSIVSEDGEFSRYIISQRQFYLRCNQEKVFPLYVLFFLHSAYGQWQLLSFSSQTGVPSIAQPATNLKKIIMPMPPYQVQKQWFARVQPMYRLILKLMKETRRLAALRDTLLPKLMSGEIDVDKVSI